MTSYVSKLSQSSLVKGFILDNSTKLNYARAHARTREDFSAESYFASHNHRLMHRVAKKRRELTSVEAAIFYAAKQMIADGHSVEDAVAWARKEAAR